VLRAFEADPRCGAGFDHDVLGHRYLHRAVIGIGDRGGVLTELGAGGVLGIDGVVLARSRRSRRAVPSTATILMPGRETAAVRPALIVSCSCRVVERTPIAGGTSETSSDHGVDAMTSPGTPPRLPTVPT